MNWWEALILGIVQGASEFLPISSSGHLILLEKLHIGSESLPFNIALHLGTLAAVVIVMRKKIFALFKKGNGKKLLCLLVACVPTVIIALVIKICFPDLLGGRLLGFGFVLTACLLFMGEKFQIAKSTVLTPKISILTGVLQGIAVLPGVSRSGATVSVLTAQGVDRSEAADFSFLLSIPIILGSAALEGYEIIKGAVPLDVSVSSVAIGTAAAFISGLMAVSMFLKTIKKHSLLPFALYTLLLGVTVTLLPVFGVKI